MFARDVGSRHNERHHILQLIAKAIGAARLVIRRARPHAACQHLIQKPIVQHDVERAIGRAHLHGLNHLAPLPGDFAQHRIQVGGAVLFDQ